MTAMTAATVPVIGSRFPRLGPTDTPAHTDGPKIVAVASAAGIDLMPWQQHQLDIAAATDPDTGKWKYSDVVTVVSRQNGKTVNASARVLAGLLLFGDEIFHAAQNLVVPRDTFEVVAEAITQLLPKRSYKIIHSNGKERIEVYRAGRRFARYRILPPNQGAWRGPPATLLILDEYREYTDESVISAARPKIIAAANPQVWFMSNAGDVTSAPLIALRARGTGPNPGRLVYLEWSAEDTAAIDDLAGWAQANPALGHTINVSTLHDNLESMSEIAFRTEHLCQFVDVATDVAYPLDSWTACAVDDDPEPVKPISLAIDVDPFRREAAAVAAWNDDGRLRVAVAATWTEPLDDKRIAADIEQIRRSLRVDQIHYDALTAFGIADKLRDTTTHRVTLTALVAASAATYDAIVSGRLAHPADEYLDAAVIATGRRAAGDGGWRLTRRGTKPIPAAVAMTLAVADADTPKATLHIH